MMNDYTIYYILILKRGYKILNYIPTMIIVLLLPIAITIRACVQYHNRKVQLYTSVQFIQMCVAKYKYSIKQT